MTKSVLVIETPFSCEDCPCSTIVKAPQIDCWSAYCEVCGKANDKIMTKPDWCPLKPLPDKKKVDEEYFNRIADDDLKFGHLQWEAYKMGWNACIEELEGKK